MKKGERLPYLTNVGLVIGMIGITACAKDVAPTPTAVPTTLATIKKPIEIPGVPSPKPSPTPENFGPIIILADNLSDAEFANQRRKYDALEAIRLVFNPEFLASNGEVDLDEASSEDPSKAEWYVPERVMNKFFATVVNTYPEGKVNPRELGPSSVTTTVEGKLKVEDISTRYPWDIEGYVKPEDVDQEFSRIEKPFSLKGITIIKQHVMSNRILENGEKATLVLGITGEGVDQWGRKITFDVFPGGKFTFTFTPLEKKR